MHATCRATHRWANNYQSTLHVCYLHEAITMSIFFFQAVLIQRLSDNVSNCVIHRQQQCLVRNFWTNCLAIDLQSTTFIRTDTHPYNTKKCFLSIQLFYSDDHQVRHKLKQSETASNKNTEKIGRVSFHTL